MPVIYRSEHTGSFIDDIISIVDTTGKGDKVLANNGEYIDIKAAGTVFTVPAGVPRDAGAYAGAGGVSVGMQLNGYTFNDLFGAMFYPYKPVSIDTFTTSCNAFYECGFRFKFPILFYYSIGNLEHMAVKDGRLLLSCNLFDASTHQNEATFFNTVSLEEKEQYIASSAVNAAGDKISELTSDKPVTKYFELCAVDKTVDPNIAAGIPGLNISPYIIKRAPIQWAYKLWWGSDSNIGVPPSPMEIASGAYKDDSGVSMDSNYIRSLDHFRYNPAAGNVFNVIIGPNCRRVIIAYPAYIRDIKSIIPEGASYNAVGSFVKGTFPIILPNGSSIFYKIYVYQALKTMTEGAWEVSI